MPGRSCRVCGKEETPESPMMKCSGCKEDEIHYCSQACQKKDWSEHKKHCTKTQKKDETTSNTDSDTPPNTIKAVLSLGGQNNPFNVEPTTIPLDHPLFTPGPRQQLSYVSCLIDVPIIIWRHRTDDPMDHLTSDIRPSLDNSSITFLMIDPWSGWAPAEWQQGIGPVTIARLDKKPLTVPDLELIWMYCDNLAEVANERGTKAATLYHTPAAFQKCRRRYVKDEKLNGRDIFRIPL